jgi:hypothetical protein
MDEKKQGICYEQNIGTEPPFFSVKVPVCVIAVTDWLNATPTQASVKFIVMLPETSDSLARAVPLPIIEHAFPP